MQDEYTLVVWSLFSVSRYLFCFGDLQKAHEEHAGRFFIHEKMNYADATQKALVIIGDNATLVKSRVQHVAQTLRNKKSILEIIGLCVSINHDSYEMFLEEQESPLFFVCDRVAKCLEIDSFGRFKTAQICMLQSSTQVQKKPKASS